MVLQCANKSYITIQQIYTNMVRRIFGGAWKGRISPADLVLGSFLASALHRFPHGWYLMPPSTNAIWCSSNKYFASAANSTEKPQEDGFMSQNGGSPRWCHRTRENDDQLWDFGIFGQTHVWLVGGLSTTNHQSQPKRRHDSFPDLMSWLCLKISTKKPVMIDHPLSRYWHRHNLGQPSCPALSSSGAATSDPSEPPNADRSGNT